MHPMKSVATAIAVCVGLAAGLASANAAEAATTMTCLNKAKDVRVALKTNSGAKDYRAAKKQASYGLSFCSNGFYNKGVAHYEAALKMLGAPSS